MAKHKLFIEDENNYSLNTSTVYSSTPQRSNLHPARLRTSASQKGAVIGSASSLKSQYTAAQQSSSAYQEGSDSESDSMNVAGFFSSSNQKLPYSFDEDEEILKFILKGQRIFRVGSILLWKNLEQIKQNPKRTYQSLKNRFLRNIRPHLLTTYRHLIPDEDTVQKILIKFPELKKKVGKKVNLIAIKLPNRLIPLKPSEGNVSSTSLQHHENPERIDESKEESINSPISQHSPASPTSQHFEELDFHRKVELKGDSLTVLVNLNFKHPSRPDLVGIYETYWKLKSKNKLVPCSACGRCGGPEHNMGSDAESDAFISNSVESKKPERSSLKKKKGTGRTSKRTQNQKKNSFASESCSSQRSCSPSLLNEVDKLNELDENVAKNGESKSTAAGTFEVSNSAVLVQEADSTPGERNAVSDEDTESIYHKTMAEFRKLIDSDEEEILVKKCLRKNLKSIGFDANLTVENMQVDSYFVNSNSPGFESATANTLATGSSKSGVASGSFLAQNMIKMMNKDNI